MLHHSLACAKSENPDQEEGTLTVFSNQRVFEPITGEFFVLAPAGKVGEAWAYALTAAVYSPTPQVGTMLTPPEHVLEDVRVLLSSLLDIELSQDLGKCQRLSSKSRESDDLARLLPARYERKSIVDPACIKAAEEKFGIIARSPDGHLRLVLRALHAYDRAMVALARSDASLAYSLLVFVLDCLSQAKDKPDVTRWEDYPGAQRSPIDKAFKKHADSIPVALGKEIRDILCQTEHLKTTERFHDFVVEMLPSDFFDAPNSTVSDLPIPRAYLDRLISSAYKARSGYVHALNPVSELIRGHAEREFFRMPDGSLMLTVRGLHRVVRGVLDTFVRTRVVPSEDIPAPDLPGVVYAKLSPEMWVHSQLPRPSERNARAWLEAVIGLRYSRSLKKDEILKDERVLATFNRIRTYIESQITQVNKRLKPIYYSIAVICGAEFEEGKCKSTIETMVADVLTHDELTMDSKAALKILRRHFRSGTVHLDLPIRVELALIIALSHSLTAEEATMWVSLCRDSCTFDRRLQTLMSECVHQSSPSPSDFFPLLELPDTD